MDGRGRDSLSVARKCLARLFIRIFRKQSQTAPKLRTQPQLLLHGQSRVATAEATQSKLVLGTCPDGHAPQPHKYCQHKFRITAVGT
jgi:hypothetical protein